MTITPNRYALEFHGYSAAGEERYCALDNTTGKPATDATGCVMTRNGHDATEWLYGMNEWARKN